jgi:hypothetical protein
MGTDKVTWLLKHIEQLKATGKIRDYKILGSTGGSDQQKLSKYSNKKTIVDDIVFDSRREASRFTELKLLLKAGEIGFLELQVEYELNPGGTHSLKYISDFEYVVSKTGEKVVEDVKGFKTREYKRKRRLMKKVHGITIKEV